MKGVDKGAIPVGTDMRPVQTGGISTSLMEIVGVVAEEVKEAAAMVDCDNNYAEQDNHDEGFHCRP